MVGVISAGSYIPSFRLDRAEVAVAWGGIAPGTRAVAGVDEDTTTLAVEAARIALRRSGKSDRVSAIYFATTAPAYGDKTNATAIHAALNLAPDVAAYDLAGAVRSGAAAVRAACDHAAAGGTALAVMADLRDGLPGSATESEGGDAAVALLIGSGDDVIAELTATASRTAEFIDRARDDRGNAVVWEERFGEGRYLALARDASAALKAAGFDLSSADTVVIGGPHRRGLRVLPKALDVADSALARSVDGAIGNTGAAHPWLLLTGALEEARPGQSLGVLSVADGVDAFAFRATEALDAWRTANVPTTTVLHHTEAGRKVSYPVFLTWRGQLHREPPRRPDPTPPSPPASARSTAWKFGLVAGRCTACGSRNLPPQLVCLSCGASQSMADEPMADIPAVVRTYTVDRLAYSLSPPVVFVVVDFDGGGRMQCELTDVDEDALAVGMPVEPTFRRLSTTNGLHNYFWKARPVVPACPAGERES